MTLSIFISRAGANERQEWFHCTNVNVGSATSNDLVLSDLNVSMHHARLIRVEPGFVITDLGSAHGTFVNGRHIFEPTAVRDGDVIAIGPYTLRIILEQRREFVERVSSSAPAAASSIRRPEDYALVIGVNDYARLRVLQGAIADAQAFAAWLVHTDGGRVPLGNVRMVLSSAEPLSPIGHEINEALEDILVRANDLGGRRFYFYFSGHGCVGERASDISLCMANWSNLRRRAALSSEAWLDVVVRSGAFAEVAFFLDCCRVWAVRAVGLPPHIDYAQPVERDEPTRVFVAYATEFQRPAIERSIEGLHEVRGVFTTELLRGLSGIAMNASGVVTAESLKQHLEGVSTNQEMAKSHQRVEVRNGLCSAAQFGYAEHSTNAADWDNQVRHGQVKGLHLRRAVHLQAFPEGVDSYGIYGQTQPHDALALGFKRRRNDTPLAGWMQEHHSHPHELASVCAGAIPAVTLMHSPSSAHSCRLLVIMFDAGLSGTGWTLCGPNIDIEFHRHNTWTYGLHGSVFSAQLAPGNYLLRWAGKRDLAIGLFANFTTQVVVHYDPWIPAFEKICIYLRAGARMPHLPPSPDLAMNIDHGFQLLGPFGSVANSQAIPRKLLEIMHGNSFTDPLLGLLAGYLLTRDGNADPAHIEAIANRVDAILGPCPDGRALHLRAAMARGSVLPKEPSSLPPMFRDGLLAFVEASHIVDGIVVPGSLLESACVHRFVDSPLASWPCLSKTEAQPIDWLTIAIADVSADMLKRGKTADAREMARVLGVPTSSIEFRWPAIRVDELLQNEEWEDTSSLRVSPNGIAEKTIAISHDEMVRSATHDPVRTLELAEHLLATDPENKVLRRSVSLCRKALDVPQQLVPRMLASSDVIGATSFSKIAMSLVRSIDGVRSIKQVVFCSGAPLKEAEHELCQLITSGVIEIVCVPKA